jgi:hypothetical protein
MGQTMIEWTASPRPDGTWASGYTKRIENLRRFAVARPAAAPQRLARGSL